MSKLFSDETLAHYGIKGQKKGYNKGRRNGKPLAKTIEELRANASGRLYVGSVKSSVKSAKNLGKSYIYDAAAHQKGLSKGQKILGEAASIGTGLKSVGNAAAANVKWKLADALNPYKKKKKNTNKSSITSNLKNKSTKIKNKVSSIFKSKFKKKK